MTTWLLRLDAPGDGPRLAVKDAIDVEGTSTTTGCPAIGDDAKPVECDAPVVATARAAGARIVGKTNLTELCRSIDGVNPWTGTPSNPLDETRLPGGSSSGSAIAVATGEADVAYGSDTGGSIRVPAACCGVPGLKTTRGRLPMRGVFGLSETLDTVGPLAADIAGLELGMRLMEPGFAADPLAGAASVARLRLPSEEVVAVEPWVDRAVDAALDAAEFAVIDEDVPHWPAAIGAANLIMLAEGYAAHRHLLAKSDRISYRIRRRIERGGEVDTERLGQAHETGRAFRAALDALLDRYTVLALPTLQGEPPEVGSRDLSMTDLTVPINLAGLPALALPVPGSGSFPASLQLVGRAEGEEQLLALGAQVESAVGRRGGAGG